MATVKGPLFSLDARGQIGGAVVFGYWKGRNYVRRHAIPANPKSDPQMGMRAMMKFLSQIWATRSEAQQADWEDLAAQTSVSPFNAFVGHNMTRWRNALGPTMLYPATEDDTEATAPTLVATAGTRQITLTVGLTTMNANWGVAIYRSTSTGFTPAWNNCVQILRFETGVEKEWIDTPLTPGETYYYVQTLLSKAGLIGTPSAEDDATVL
jgi:hypothetical protein